MRYTDDEERMDQLAMMLDGAANIAKRGDIPGPKWQATAKRLAESTWERLNPDPGKPNPPRLGELFPRKAKADAP